MKLGNALRLLDALDVWDGAAAREEFAKISKPEIVWRVCYYVISLHVEINIPGAEGYDRLLPEHRIKTKDGNRMHVNRETILKYRERAERAEEHAPHQYLPKERGPFEEVVFSKALKARALSLQISLSALCAHDITEGKDWRYPRHETMA